MSGTRNKKHIKTLTLTFAPLMWLLAMELSLQIANIKVNIKVQGEWKN